MERTTTNSLVPFQPFQLGRMKLRHTLIPTVPTRPNEVKTHPQGVSSLISTGLERLEWNETTRGRSFHSKLFVSILNFQATKQPTRTENKPTEFCGGTAQLDPKTCVPSRGQRVLLTQRMTLHANIPQGKSLRAGGASHPSRTFGESLEVMISPSRLDDDS